MKVWMVLDLMTPENEFSKRLKNVRAKMEMRRIEVLVIYSASGSLRFGQRGHVMYISGYEPYFGHTMMILPLDEDLSPLLEIDASGYFPSESTWIENVRPAGDHIRDLKEYLLEVRLEKAKIGLVGEYSMSSSLYAGLVSEFGRSRIEVASDILESERVVKSEYEVQCIKKACEIAGEGIEAAAKFARVGVSEGEIVSEIERVCRITGSQGFPHYTMVSSGRARNHVDWWWYCRERKLEQGDPWNLDFGTMYKGYCCDVARPFSLGAPSEKQGNVFQVLVQALEAAQRATREGVLASEVDRAASEVLEEAWGGDWMGIGHGVGLEVHEWPFVGWHKIVYDKAYRDMKLKTNMVISIEPQVTLPEVGYMQIEDVFRVTKRGCEVLTDVPREIIET